MFCASSIEKPTATQAGRLGYEASPGKQQAAQVDHGWSDYLSQTLFVFTGTSSRLIAATTNVNPAVNPNHMPLALNPALANNDMTDEYRANLDPASVEYQVRVAASKFHLIAWSLYVSTLWCLKLCIAVFYTRLA